MSIDSNPMTEAVNTRTKPLGFLKCLKVAALLAIGLSLVGSVYYMKLVVLPRKQAEIHAKRVLHTVGLVYHEFYAAHKESPHGLRELKEFSAEYFGSSPSSARDTAENGFKMIEDGALVLVWNAVFTADGGANDQFCLGYQAQTPVTGGFVIHGGGFVEAVSPKEFAAIPPIATSTNTQ